MARTVWRWTVNRSAVLALVATTMFAGCQDDRPLEAPRPLYGEDPVEYPIDLFDMNIEGEAMLRVRVTERGDVDSVQVEESAGHIGLDSAAVNSLLRTRFTPARRGEDFVEAWVHVPVRFSTRPRPSDRPNP